MLISIWIPKGAALIRGRRLLEVRCLLDDIWNLLSNCYCSQQQMNLLEGTSTDWTSLQISEAAISRCFLAILEEFAKFAGIPTKWRSFSSTAGCLDLYLYLWVTPLCFCDKCNRSVSFKISATHMTRRVNSNGSSFSVSKSFSKSVLTRFQSRLIKVFRKMYLYTSDGFS